MKFLTLDYIRQHSRIDYDCEDEILNLYGSSAETTLAAYLGYLDDNNAPSVDKMMEAFSSSIPAPLVQAALMLVDVSYQHRSPVSSQNMSIVPYTFDIMIKPYIKL